VHTVIITDRRTTPLFTQYRRLFAPFLVERGGTVCHCPWHETGRDIEQTVPDLYKAIKGYPEWRAIILVHPAQNDNPYNPFDFACNRGRELPIKENDSPLVRLTHMLAGFPSLGVKGYDTVYTYYNGKAGRFLECKVKSGKYNGKNILQSWVDKLNDDDRVSVLDSLFKKYSNIKLRLIETPYNPEEQDAYTRLTKSYAFKENRPVEVLILSTRKLDMADDHKATHEVIRRVWQFHDEEESSDFWKVYPNTCRFLCYNLINPEHTLYKGELWRFFLLALTLAVNRIPGQMLQAYRLYKANLHINADELKYLLDRHIENLLSVQSIIQERVMHVTDLTQDKEKELVPNKDISVKFEHVDEGDVKVDSRKLGLASDCPVPETRFWREHILGTKQTIDNILFAPQEIVAAKALETRNTANSFAGREQVLDRFQLERIRKHMDELESRIINTNVYGMLDADARMAEVAEAGDTVRKFLGLRLTKRNILLISLCSFLVYLSGYIPYFLNSARISWAVFGASFGLAAIAALLLGIGGFLALLLMRTRLVNKLKDYNKTVRGIFDRVNKSAQVYANYFSSVCTYIYARSLLSGVTLKHDNDYQAAKVQNAHLVSIENEIKLSRELCSLYGAPANDSSMSNAYLDIKEEVLVESPSKSQFYELTPNKVKDTLKLTSAPKMRQPQQYVLNEKDDECEHYDTGITLNAPYNFISGMSLVREEIYNKREDINDKKEGA
jgi:hypothetical protein